MLSFSIGSFWPHDYRGFQWMARQGLVSYTSWSILLPDHIKWFVFLITHRLNILFDINFRKGYSSNHRRNEGSYWSTRMPRSCRHWTSQSRRKNSAPIWSVYLFQSCYRTGLVSSRNLSTFSNYRIKSSAFTFPNDEWNVSRVDYAPRH